MVLFEILGSITFTLIVHPAQSPLLRVLLFRKRDLLNLWNTNSKLQSTAFSISFVVTSKFSVSEEAPLTEWALKTHESMPAVSNNYFNHLAMVLEDTALYGFIIITRNFVSVPLFGKVCAS